jgi:hypothetical protein
MNFEEASKLARSKDHLLNHVYQDTIDLVLMDLYIAYQDDVTEASSKRIYLKKSVEDIIDSYLFPKSTDGVNWDVENCAKRHVHEDILFVLEYILEPDSPKPTYIPHIFSKRLASKGIELSVANFYCYR